MCFVMRCPCLVLQVAGGPVVQVRLCAAVTMPAITVSKDTLQFDTVQCSMCQVIMRPAFYLSGPKDENIKLNSLDDILRTGEIYIVKIFTTLSCNPHALKDEQESC